MKNRKVTDPSTRIEDNMPSFPSGKETRKKNIDFANIGKRKSLSDILCHQCRRQLQANDENSCKAIEKSITIKRTQGGSFCKKKFCTQCLIKHYPEAYQELKQSNEMKSLGTSNWLCPSCQRICTCSQCVRKRERVESMMNFEEDKLKVSIKRSKNRFNQEQEGKKKEFNDFIVTMQPMKRKVYFGYKIEVGSKCRGLEEV